MFLRPGYILFLSVGLLWVLFLNEAQAQDPACQNVVSPVQDVICRSRINETEEQLNLTYQSLLDVMSVDLKPLLLKEQQSWQAYRDDACFLEGRSYGFGTMGTSTKIACTAKMNTDRILFMKERISLWKQ